MPATRSTSGAEESYSPLVGCVFVFNLMVGTGALTMPAAFADAGWIVSSISVFLLSLMSFVTLTFIVESMSIANGLIKADRYRSQDLDQESPPQDVSPEMETSPLMGNRIDRELVDLNNLNGSSDPKSRMFDIEEKVELGQMAAMFFPRKGLNWFYACIILYLYGDLVIYAAAISKSLRDVICTYDNCTKVALDDSDLCWIKYEQLDRSAVYRILIITIACLLGPFAFFNVQKTKYLQLFTTFLRWVSFTSMITLCFVAIFQGRNQGNPPRASILHIPALFGVSVYSFMCHHSLPALITPINNKQRLYLRIGSVYLLILAFYYLLSFTGIFTFPVLNDVFTLNFQKERCSENPSRTSIVPQLQFFEYFLPLFPVFTLATSFPIIAITLTMNLRTLLVSCLRSTPRSSIKKKLIHHSCFPLITLIPPILIALTTENLEVLVGYVGSYAGTGIQYIIPALLVYYARSEHHRTVSDDRSRVAEYLKLSCTEDIRLRFQSPFKHRYWINFVLIWSVVCIILVTINHLTDIS